MGSDIAMKEKELINDNHCTCRKCINKQYSIKLLPKNCYYAYYQSECVMCGEMHQMIQKLRFMGKIKLLFAKRTKEKRIEESILDTW